MIVCLMLAAALATPFTEQMSDILSDPQIKHADVGISVRRLDDSTAVYLHQHDQTFVPRILQPFPSR